MKGNFWNWLPGLLALVAVTLALRSEPRQATCYTEERYENQVMCEDVQFGYRTPYPDNCTLFLVCDYLYPTVCLCPAQLWWDNKTQTCEWPQNTECIYYTIETTPKTTNAPTTETTPIITSDGTITTEEENWPTSSYDPPPAPPGIEDTFCKNYPDGSVHRYPYDCNAYINCTHGWPVLNYCEPDKVFNQLLLICDTPDTAQCEPLPLPPSTTTTATTTAEPTTTTEDGQCGAPPEGIEEDYCQPLGNGFYEYPYDCSAYIRCRNGCSDMDYCIPDKLFNPLLHICDTPNSVDCDPTPYPTTTIATTPGSTEETSSSTAVSTTTVATTTTPSLPADVDPDLCEGLPDNTRFPYAAECSQFLQCRDNQVVMGQCPEKLLFNPDLLICDDADDVICYGDRTTTTSTTPEPTTTTNSTTVTTTPTTTPGPAELCANEELGVSYPYVEDCTKYILCMGDGDYYIAPCISNTYYDPKTGNCGADVSPTACKEQETITTTTEATTETTTTEVVSTTSEAPTTTTTTTESPVQPGGICGNKDEGEMIAYPKDCSKYIVCVTPIPIAFYCRPNSYFSMKQQQCVSWEESDCDKDTATTTTPGYTQAPSEPEPEPTMCTNSSRETFPYPENCQWFIRCVNDYIYMMDVCNCGEYYDPISGKCGADVPSDACRWDYTSTTTTEAPTTAVPPVTRPPPQKGPCDDAADGELVPYPNDCSKYIQCDRPIPSAFDCDAGEEFSPTQRQCMESSLANCTVATTPAPAETTTGSTSSEPGSTTDDESTESSSTPETSTTPEASTTPETSETTPETSSSTESPTTTESTTTPAPSGGICGGKPNGTLVPYPNDCGKYIVCQEPIPIGYDCPQGLEFSPTELECMDPELANCIPATTTTEPLTTTEATPATTTTPDSSSSITESSSETTSETTPIETESTTPETSTSATDSTTSETTTVATTTTEATTTTIHPDTPNICCGYSLGTILPYPNDCHRYVVCDYPIPYAVDCEEGTVFDVENLKCTAEGTESCI